MRYILVGSIITMILATLFTKIVLKKETGDLPVLTWITGNDQYKVKTLKLFKQWQEETGAPEFDIEIEVATFDPNGTQKLIRAISGVGPDLFDLYGHQALFYQSIGLLRDVTDDAIKNGYSVNETYKASRSQIEVDGRQYGYPRNAAANNVWVNLEAFKEVGMDPPAHRWTIDEFEEMGNEYVKRTKDSEGKYTKFFVDQLSRPVLRRSMGFDDFNETMTRSLLDDPRNADLYERMYRWSYDEHLFPRREDLEALSANTNKSYLRIFLFAKKNYALLWGARWHLIFLRDLNPIELDAVESPHFGYPNTLFSTGTIGIYTGSKHPELASYFLRFLASEKFNSFIVDSGDSLPPNPIYTQTEAFRHPADYPNEGKSHIAFAEAAQTIAIPSYSGPYITFETYARIMRDAWESFEAGIKTAKEATHGAADRIHNEMMASVNSSPKVKARYEKALEAQKEIDRLKKEGLPIPAPLISNPFYLKYYADKGWLTQN
jgi:multiple sugar transport system substrate-binding protein